MSISCRPRLRARRTQSLWRWRHSKPRSCANPSRQPRSRPRPLPTSFAHSAASCSASHAHSPACTSLISTASSASSRPPRRSSSVQSALRFDSVQYEYSTSVFFMATNQLALCRFSLWSRLAHQESLHSRSHMECCFDWFIADCIPAALSARVLSTRSQSVCASTVRRCFAQWRTDSIRASTSSRSTACAHWPLCARSPTRRSLSQSLNSHLKHYAHNILCPLSPTALIAAYVVILNIFRLRNLKTFLLIWVL